MSTPTARELLAQADRLMRQRAPEELPVLTDLVIEEIEIMSLSDRMDDVIPTHARPAWAPPPQRPLRAPLPASAFVPVTSPSPAAPTPLARPSVPPADMRDAVAPDVVAPDVFGVRPSVKHDEPPTSALDSTTVTALANVRDQFNAQLLTRLEELQHGVYIQVMQQLEIYAAGSLKAHVRDMLLPALTDIVRDLATQVAEDTSTQVREVVSKAVDSEIARLREQLSKRRMTDGRT